MAKKVSFLYLLLLLFINYLEASPMGEWISSKDRSAFDSISSYNIPVAAIIIISISMIGVIILFFIAYRALKLPDRLYYFKKGMYSKYSDDIIEDDEYEMVVSGIYDASQVKIALEPGVKVFPEEVWEMVDEEWKVGIASGYNLKDSVLYGLTSYKIHKNEIHLNLQKTSYKAFYGTNIRHPSHPTIVGHTADVISFCAVIETLDKKILFVKKNTSVHEYKGKWHLPGSNFEKIDNDKINAFEYVSKKLQPECGVTEKDIESIVCLGMGRTLFTQKPELIFYVKVKIHGDFLKDLAKKAYHCIFNAEFATIPSTEVHQFVSLNKFSPIGIAAIMQYLELAYERTK